METIGITPEQIAVVVGFILPFDRPLDMLRTVVNVGGDLSVSTAVANWEGEFDADRFNRPLEDSSSVSVDSSPVSVDSSPVSVDSSAAET